MKILIFDTILDGHHSDYILHLMDYWNEQQWPGELWVVTPAGFSESLPAEYQHGSGVKFAEITEEELHQVRSGSTLRRSFAEWNLFLGYAHKIQPTHALLMYFDLFQVGMWLGKKAPCPVSGIYFRPSFHYTHIESRKDRLVAFRKKWLLRRVLSTPELSTLFCLDKSSVATINKMTKRVRVLPLSDPVKYYRVAEEDIRALRTTLGIEDHRKVFLMFGYLDDRKGIERVLEAIEQLACEESTQLALVLAGPIADAYRQAVDARIATLKSKAQVICEYTKLSGSVIQTYFELADFILTLYQRHIGMSSIVVRAALSRKPLISSDFGYMGSLVQSEELGLGVDSESVMSITGALRQALRGQVKVSSFSLQQISEQNTAQLYARQILNVLAQTPTLTE